MFGYVAQIDCTNGIMCKMKTSKKKKLHVGLLMDTLYIPAWVHLMLERITMSDYVKISIIILNTNAKRRNALSKKRWNTICYYGYCRLENILFRQTPPHAFKIINADALLSGIPILRVTPKQTESSDWLEDGDIEEIEKYGLDVLVKLGFRELRGDIFKTSRFGIWSYHKNDIEINDTVPTGFWEVLEKQPVTRSILWMFRNDSGKGKVIYDSYSSTLVSSVNRNCNMTYWKTTSFLPRKLYELYSLGQEKFLANVDQGNTNFSSVSDRSTKGNNNREIIIPLTKHILSRAKTKVRKQFFDEQWILLFDLRNRFPNSLFKFTKMIPPKDRFWADPHVIHKNGKYFIFIEESKRQPVKGHISVIIMDEKGNYGEPTRVIERPYHLSYPFVFEYKGEYYMIPESSENRTIEIYKCVKFPYKWEFQANLMENTMAYDATIFYFCDKWWLFTNLIENNGASSWDELFLFYSDSLLNGTWLPHPKNPVISDVRKARPAGKIFQQDGNLYRPSQNCSKRYGHGLKINKIEKLSETEYHEVEVNSIRPNWDKSILGVHSFCREKDLTLLDAIFRRSIFF